MKENAAIKIVAGFFAVAGVLLLLEGAALAIVSFGIFPILNTSDIGAGFIVGIIIIILAVYAIIVSHGLHALRRWAYKATYVLTGLFLLFTAYLFMFQNHPIFSKITASLVILDVLNIVANLTIFLNQNFFKDSLEKP